MQQRSTQHEKSPLVSVIVPAYNAALFIAKTLDSIQAQTYTNFEVLVVDDGSQDQTAAIVTTYAQHDRRIQLLQQQNAGVAAARNLGITMAQGEFIAPIDADDIWYPHNLEKQVHCLLKADPSVGLVYSWLLNIDENNLPSGGFCASRIEGSVYTTLLCHDFIANASCVLIRRTCLQTVGGYDSSLKARNGQGCEDWELYLRIAEHYQIRVVPAFLVGYRKLSNSMSRNYQSMARSRELVWESIRKKYPNVPTLLYRLSTSSFYINLARQSSKAGQAQTALFWLYQAICKDPITPFLRLDSYQLLVKSGLHLLSNKIQQSIEQQPTTLAHAATERSSKLSPEPSTNINIKVLAENLLNRLLPVIFGAPALWTAHSSKPQSTKLLDL